MKETAKHLMDSDETYAKFVIYLNEITFTNLVQFENGLRTNEDEKKSQRKKLRHTNEYTAEM